MSAETDEIQSRILIDGFLARCSLLLRFRRFLQALSIGLAVIGAAFLLFRAVSYDLPSLVMILLSAFCFLASLVFTLLPIKSFAIETQIDKRCETGAVFSAYRTAAMRGSVLAPAVIRRAAEAAKRIRSINSVSFRIAPLVSVAAFGCLLMVIAMIIPDKQMFSAQQNFVRLIDEMKAAATPTDVASSGVESDFTRNLETALSDIKKQWDEGEHALALTKLNELLNSAKAAISRNATDDESKMRESGIPDEIAKMIASGFEREGSFSGSSVSSNSLSEVSKRIGGALGASLAKAAQAQTGSQEQALLLAQAAEVARRLRAEEASRLAALSYISGNYEQLLAGLSETERDKFLKTFTSSNARPEAGQNAPSKPADNKLNNDAFEIVRLAVESPSYPVEFRPVIIRYSNKD